jgi:hypothetical protein
VVRCFPTGLQIEVQHARTHTPTHTHTQNSVVCYIYIQEGVPSNGREWNVGAGPNTPQHSATSYFTAGKIEDTRNSSQLLPIRHRVEWPHLYSERPSNQTFSSVLSGNVHTIRQGRLYPHHDVPVSHLIAQGATIATRAFHQLPSLLGAFAESRKSTISFVICLSIRLSV